MTVTYGFYDSLSGDRKYNAKQMSQLFKGIITDGVFQTVGGGLIVTINSGMTLNVASGRAWFNNTWTDNDGTITVTVLASEAVLNRIDAVVVEVNSDIGTRANSIKVIKGTPATTPVPPTMANTATLHQYPLAYVSVLAGVTSITSDKLTNKVGSTECPFAMGAVPTFDFGPLLTTWQASFSNWFNNLVNQLSGSQVANLQAQIDVLSAQLLRQDNYKIDTQIATNSIVFSIKTLAGTDPTGANPCRFKVGDTVYTLNTAYTFTVTPGISWCGLGSNELINIDTDLFVYAIEETGATAGLKFGFSRIPYAKTIGDFTNTFADERYLVSDVGTRNATDKVANIGRFRAQITTASLYWAQPNSKTINRPIYETDWLIWTPTHSRSGTNYTNLPTQGQASYKLENDICVYDEYHTQNATPGGSGAQRFTVPFTFRQRSVCPSMNLTTVIGFIAFLENTLNYISLFRSSDGVAEVTGSSVYVSSGRFQF